MGFKTKKDFPIKEEVKDCYLKRVAYKVGERDDGTPWEALIFSILHRDSWINVFIESIKVKEFQSKDKLEQRKYQKEVAMERMLRLFLSSEEMRAWNRGLPNIEKTFKAYCEYLIKAIEEKDYKSVSLNLKTMPSQRGAAYISPIGTFIKRSDDIHTVLQYSDWERDRIAKL